MRPTPFRAATAFILVPPLPAPPPPPRPPPRLRPSRLSPDISAAAAVAVAGERAEEGAEERPDPHPGRRAPFAARPTTPETGAPSSRRAFVASIDAKGGGGYVGGGSGGGPERAAPAAAAAAAVAVRRIGPGVGDECPGVGRRRCDSTSPREWMERLEAADGVCGAYTVIRCDVGAVGSRRCEGGEGGDAEGSSGGGGGGGAAGAGGRSPRRRVWGEDFHLRRLASSYRELCASNGVAAGGDDRLEAAVDDSRAVLDALLSESERAEGPAAGPSPLAGLMRTVMVTLLWTPPAESYGSADGPTDPAVVVRGHALDAGLPSSLSGYDPDPIVAAVAVPPRPSAGGDDPAWGRDWARLPNRWEKSPEAKLSSWCRERRLIEDGYKVAGVGEVLLARPLQGAGGDYEGEPELLEGLTSNLFVVYVDGTVRTAPSGVLGGFARHLVLRCAGRCGVRCDARPIALGDAGRGLWAEAFITSAVRLAVPVGRILIPREEGWDCQGGKRDLSFEELWAERPLEDLAWSRRRWRVLYEEMCKDDHCRERLEQRSSLMS